MAVRWCVVTVIALALGLVISISTMAAHGADVSCMKDMKCLKKPPTPAQLDMEWASKVGDWYFNAGSMLDVYLVASELLNVPIDEVAPSDLYYKSCFHFIWGERSFLTGFGGKKSELDMKPDPTSGVGGWFTFRMPNLKLDGNKVAITLTDNETFAFLYICWPQTEDASWALVSTVPSLPDGKMKEIWAHAKSLGFSEKQFTSIRYETCNTCPIN